MSGMKSLSLVVFSNHSAFHRWSAQNAALLLLPSDELISCCAACATGNLDLRCSALPPDERVRAEWSRCPGSMARRARDSLAPLRRSSTGWMPARIGRLSAGLGRRHPVANDKASLMTGSMRRVWALQHQVDPLIFSTRCLHPVGSLWWLHFLFVMKTLLHYVANNRRLNLL